MREEEKLTPRRRVTARLWELDAEYERLKETLEDPKLALAALKQQADLLAQISRQAGEEEGRENGDEHEAADPETAVKELREIYRRLGPVLGM